MVMEELIKRLLLEKFGSVTSAKRSFWKYKNIECPICEAKVEISEFRNHLAQRHKVYTTLDLTGVRYLRMLIDLGLVEPLLKNNLVKSCEVFVSAVFSHDYMYHEELPCDLEYWLTYGGYRTDKSPYGRCSMYKALTTSSLKALTVLTRALRNILGIGTYAYFDSLEFFYVPTRPEVVKLAHYDANAYVVALTTSNKLKELGLAIYPTLYWFDEQSRECLQKWMKVRYVHVESLPLIFETEVYTVEYTPITAFKWYVPSSELVEKLRECSVEVYSAKRFWDVVEETMEWRYWKEIAVVVRFAKIYTLSKEFYDVAKYLCELWNEEVVRYCERYGAESVSEANMVEVLTG